ncbi:MAG: 1-(5-phosphoribosyl)-5-[(5-phosphoribosylamino)methylideneamino]imidazole-4-carboxamide isomerase [Candidatus Omnitrophica bacterium]|nr:1-(5-phosphoribosyl)-5-[(5-phosphoribosylamino)methylideneamino]imidazole-4-carboxamide isomerase [Candidatus Omnitrophota bacterium]
MFSVYPAIDLRNGKVVRLYKGLYNKETIYSEDPVDIAKQWKAAGTQVLHIIDLDGAFVGKSKNLGVVKRIISECKLNVHLGGGIRSKEAIEQAINAGVHRVIMSTKIFQDKNFLSSLSEELKDKILVSIDSKDGVVMDKGWRGQTSLSVMEALRVVEVFGIKTCVVTDITQDGTLMGPNVLSLEKILSSTKMKIIAAGGMSSLDDVKTMAQIKKKHANLNGVIIGKALYEGKIDLKEAIDCAS